MFHITSSFLINILASGRGIVASETIPQGSFVVVYVGKRVLQEPEGDDTYLYEITRSQKRPVW